MTEVPEFPKEEIKEILEKFFYDEIVEAIVKEKRRVVLDFSEIERINIAIAAGILNYPEQVIPLFESAIAEIKPPTPKEFEEGKQIRLRVRFKNLPESCKVEIKDLRSEHLGKMVVVEGVVKIATDVRPIARAVKYKCQNCRWESDWVPLELFQPPPKMVCPNCKKSKDVVVYRRSLVDAQRVVLEEFPEIAEGQPKKLNVILLDDLVDPELQRYTIPGKRVRVSGILKDIQVKKKGMYDFILIANNIEPLSEEIEEIVLTEEDVKKIKELAKDPKILDKIVESIAPSIAGYEEIKKAIALQLFGGVRKERPDGTRVRGDIHILLVGDPGVGKSLTHSQKIIYKEGDAWKIESIGEFFDRMAKKYGIKKERGMEFVEIREEIFVPSINPNTLKFELKKVKRVIRHASPRTVLLIRTKCGREVVVTEDHSLLTFDGSKVVPIEGSKVKKKLILPLIRMIPRNKTLKEVKGKGKRIPLTRDLGYLLGFFLGDGSVVHSGSNVYIEIKMKSRRVFQKIRRTLKDLGINFGESKDKVLYRLLIYERWFVNWIVEEFYKEFRRTGRKGEKTRMKRLPEWVLNSNEEFLLGLIEGIVDSNGSVERGFIHVYFTNRELFEMFQYILLSLGFIFTSSSSRKRYRGKFVDCYRIRVVKGRYKLKILKGFYRYSRVDNVDKVVLPRVLVKRIRESGLTRRILPLRKLGGEFRGEVYRGYVGREYAKRILKFVSSEELKSIVENEFIFWDYVVEVKKVNIRDIEEKWEYVYDLSVEDNENFVAGMIFVHNSQILKHVSKLAPKGMYVSGKGATGVGITAAVSKDELLGGWALEVGPAVLMSGGILCIDELDKIKKDDLIALHEMLEQQTITISKANIHATLRAETTVLAAANPKFGRFDPYRPIPEQIDLPPTIINRFDLIFPLKDIPDLRKDSFVMEHIVKGHIAPEELKPKIPLDLLRKYIAYARQNVFPRLTEEAAEEIKKFYLKLRSKAQAFGEGVRPIPISPRQLEALIRLSEAVARIKLKEKVEKEDVEVAIELMRYYLREVGMDPETGMIDIDRVMTGIPAKKRDKIAKIISIIERLSEEFGGSAPVDEILKEAELENIDASEARRILDELKRKGEIFEPVPGKFALT